VPARNQIQLTSVERQALVLIRELRRQVLDGELAQEFRKPARLAHYLIACYHGHAQLRMSRIAPELGVAMRTLQRSFRTIFRTSMKDYQIETRLKFAQYLLSSNPGLKMSVIAKELGYDDPNVFERFFRDHAGASPHAWNQAEQAHHFKEESCKDKLNG
jgi:transcriptional regulator GlxA family with amidase domain